MILAAQLGKCSASVRSSQFPSESQEVGAYGSTALRPERSWVLVQCLTIIGEIGLRHVELKKFGGV